MIHTGDCVGVMAAMEPESVDAIVTDPPAGISFMGKGWDHHKGGREQWVAWMTEVMGECYRVLKPGGHVLVWALPRSSHWTGWAIESAGFEMRDKLIHAFASGFPKSLNLPGGLGTALKPAYEDWWLARKPLRGTVAANVLAHGTGALNIGATRIGVEPVVSLKGLGDNRNLNDDGWKGIGQRPEPTTNLGRWPANLLLTDPIFDGGVEGVVGGGTTDVAWTRPSSGTYEPSAYGLTPPAGEAGPFYGDSGTYSRFFLIPKAARSDREPVLRGQVATRAYGQSGGAQAAIARGEEYQGNGASTGLNRVKQRENLHPTVKPVELMRHLVRLVTPPGGTILDPFLGSGTTAIAAEMEGFAWIGIEREPEYVAIAEARLNGTQRGLGLDVAAPTRKAPKTHPDIRKHRPKRRAPADNYTGGWAGTVDEVPA